MIRSVSNLLVTNCNSAPYVSFEIWLDSPQVIIIFHKLQLLIPSPGKHCWIIASIFTLCFCPRAKPAPGGCCDLFNPFASHLQMCLAWHSVEFPLQVHKLHIKCSNCNLLYAILSITLQTHPPCHLFNEYCPLGNSLLNHGLCRFPLYNTMGLVSNQGEGGGY